MNGHFEGRAPYARLVAATDGSVLAGMALVGAAQLASRTKAELYVFHVVGDMEGEAAVRRQVAELLEDVPSTVEIRNLIAGTPMSPARLVNEFADEIGDTCRPARSLMSRSKVRAASACNLAPTNPSRVRNSFSNRSISPGFSQLRPAVLNRSACQFHFPWRRNTVWPHHRLDVDVLIPISSSRSHPLPPHGPPLLSSLNRLRS